MSDETKKTMDEALEDLFAESKSNIEQIVDLPSKGMGYPGGKSKVTIRTMTFDDEKALSESTPDQDVIDLLLSRCAKDIDPELLYSADKIFLLFKIRELSYGTSVKLAGPCSKCKTTNNLDVDLSKLEVIPISDDFEDPKKVSLPDLGKDIYIRIPRSNDLEYLSNKSMILSNLWRFVTKLDRYTDPRVITAAIKKLTSKDVRLVIEGLLVEDFGIQNSAKYICTQCRSENVIEVPISEAFFTLS